MDDGESYDPIAEALMKHMDKLRVGHLNSYIPELVELASVHNLDLVIEMGSKNTKVLGSPMVYSKSILIAKTSNRDHIKHFEVLGKVTGLFFVEQIDSLDPTKWWYEVTPTV